LAVSINGFFFERKKMKNLVILFLLLSSFNFAQQAIIKGKVVDAETLKPLYNANVFITDKSTGGTTNQNGEFSFSSDINNGVLTVSFIGYNTAKISLLKVDINKEVTIQLVPKLIPSQTVLVEGSMDKEGVTPVAFSKVTQSEIEKNYVVQDIPEYLGQLPSTTFYSENGNGIGYNYLTIRGFDQRRISVSINGIPQNDPEDHNVYWLDFPDLLSKTAVIQVQRGAGSGVVGYPAIGGSINIITSTFSNHPELDFSASMGSYNTKKYSASYSSGLIDEKYSIYANLSQILSSGYRNSAWVQYNAYYLSAVRYDDNLTTQINLYGGPIADGLAYTGLPKFAITDKNLRKANYSDWGQENGQYTYTVERRPDEIENYSQPHFELMNEYRISPDITFNSALFLVFGQGFFDFDGSWADTTYLRLTSQYGFHPAQNPQDVLIKAEADNTQYGWVPRLSIKHTNGELIIGGEFRIHRSVHWGSIDFGNDLPDGLTKSYRYYYYNGAKDIANGFVHETYDLSSQVNVLGEVQLAYHKYRFYNEEFLNHDFSVSNVFVNPRFGINYKIDPSQSLFFSFARVSNEPRLSDYYNGDESSGGEQPHFATNADGSYDYNNPLVKPETMNDFELGYSFINKKFSATLNLFYMLFNDEIVANGKVDIFGQPIVGNMKETAHRGIELSAAYYLPNGFNITGSATFSNNRIITGTYYIDSNNSINLDGNNITGSPDFLTNFGINYTDKNLFVQFLGKYVGCFYSDNFGDKLNQYLNQYPGFVSYPDNKNNAYFNADIFASYQFKGFSALSPSKIFIKINNIFDRLYSANAIGGQFFPMAERNFVAGVQVGL
jgi:iron complex outermembrane recepter protein